MIKRMHGVYHVFCGPVQLFKTQAQSGTHQAVLYQMSPKEMLMVHILRCAQRLAMLTG